MILNLDERNLITANFHSDVSHGFMSIGTLHVLLQTIESMEGEITIGQKDLIPSGLSLMN